MPNWTRRLARGLSLTFVVGLVSGGDGCGSAAKYISGVARSPSKAVVRDGGSWTVPSGRRARGDYDADEYEHGRTDGDHDDSNERTDRDNDFDNPNNSYYDSDDDMMLRYGHAADVAERRAIAKVVDDYYHAAAAGDGARGCSLQSQSIAASIPSTLGQPPGPPYYRGGTCAVVMTKVFAMNSHQLSSYAASLHVAHVRLGHGQGWAVLVFNRLPGRAIYVRHEHRKWTIDAVLDHELP